MKRVHQAITLMKPRYTASFQYFFFWTLMIILGCSHVWLASFHVQHSQYTISRAQQAQLRAWKIASKLTTLQSTMQCLRRKHVALIRQSLGLWYSRLIGPIFLYIPWTYVCEQPFMISSRDWVMWLDVLTHHSPKLTFHPPCQLQRLRRRTFRSSRKS